MKICTTKPLHGRLATGVDVRVRPLAAACAAILAAASVPAYAQQAKPDSADAGLLDAVIVTGIRHGIEDAIEIKRSSDLVVEAISAEDIGKLPDVSIAESLARLPGIAGQRVNGRVQALSIRGLPPDFSTTLLNGREQASVGDNRAAEFDQYPSELINSVVVYKTADAGLVSAGLSGTADLRTVRPLSMSSKVVALNLRGERNSLGELNSDVHGTGARLSASFINQYLDHTLGLALGYAHLDSPSQEQHYKSWWWDKDCGDNCTGSHSSALVLNGAELEAFSRRQSRDGLMAVVEYKPNEAFHTTADMYYSEFTQAESMRGAMWYQSLWTGSQILNPAYSTVGGSEFVSSGTATNVAPILRNDYNRRKDKMFAVGVNQEFSTDNWHFAGDLSYSMADSHQPTVETYAGLQPAGALDSLAYNISMNGISQFTPGLNYADASRVQLGDPAPWGGWGHDGTVHDPSINDKIKAIKVSAERDLKGVFSYVATGVNFQIRDKTREQWDSNLFLNDNRAPVNVGSWLLEPATSLGFGGIPGVLTYDVMRAIQQYYHTSPINDPHQWNKDWTVSEKLSTAYLKLGIDSSLGRVGVRGNLGLEIKHTAQESTAFNINTNNSLTAPNSDSASYNDVLPSLNLVFDVGSQTFVKLGAGETVARPRMDDMRASRDASISVRPGSNGIPAAFWSGNGGNPQLRPWKADAYDLSLEKYFSKASYVGIAGFYKKLKTYIYNQDTVVDFTGVPSNGMLNPNSPMGPYTRPANGEGGKLKGLEFSLALEGKLLSPLLEGFGFIGSASTTSTTIHPDGPGTVTTIPGMSPKVRTGELYYDRYGFSARISERYRSAFRGEVTFLYSDRTFTEIQADRQTDLQLGYAIQSGSAKGLSFLFQVNNLADSPYRTSSSTALTNGSMIPETYEVYGRQYLLGVNYRL